MPCESCWRHAASRAGVTWVPSSVIEMASRRLWTVVRRARKAGVAVTWEANCSKLTRPVRMLLT